MKREPIPLKILLVDDETHTRRLFKTELDKWFEPVQTADNGSEALQKIQAEAFDLLVLDYWMPYMDGTEVIDILCLMEQGRNLPVIMLLAKTASDEFNRRMWEWNDPGVVGTLMKPFHPAELSFMIRQLWEQWSVE